MLQQLCDFRRESLHHGHRRRALRRRVERKSAHGFGRSNPRLPRGATHGTRPHGRYRRHAGGFPLAAGGGERQGDRIHGAIQRGARPDRPHHRGEGRQHTLAGQAHTPLHHGAAGALAGGDHDLRRRRPGDVHGRCVREIRHLRFAPRRLGDGSTPLLCEHLRQIWPAGGQGAGQGGQV